MQQEQPGDVGYVNVRYVDVGNLDVGNLDVRYVDVGNLDVGDVGDLNDGAERAGGQGGHGL
jgi:hypothetical protein